MQSPGTPRADCNLDCFRTLDEMSDFLRFSFALTIFPKEGKQSKHYVLTSLEIILLSWVLSPTWYIIRFFCFSLFSISRIAFSFLGFNFWPLFAESINDCEEDASAAEGILMSPAPLRPKPRCLSGNVPWVHASQLCLICAPLPQPYKLEPQIFVAKTPSTSEKQWLPGCCMVASVYVDFLRQTSEVLAYTFWVSGVFQSPWWLLRNSLLGLFFTSIVQTGSALFVMLTSTGLPDGSRIFTCYWELWNPQILNFL